MELEKGFEIVDELAEKINRIICDSNQVLEEKIKLDLKDISEGIKKLIIEFPNKEAKGGIMLSRDIEARFLKNFLYINYHSYYDFINKNSDNTIIYKTINESYPVFKISIQTAANIERKYGMIMLDMSDMIMNDDFSKLVGDYELEFNKIIEKDDYDDESINYLVDKKFDNLNAKEDKPVNLSEIISLSGAFDSVRKISEKIKDIIDNTSIKSVGCDSAESSGLKRLIKIENTLESVSGEFDSLFTNFHNRDLKTDIYLERIIEAMFLSKGLSISYDIFYASTNSNSDRTRDDIDIPKKKKTYPMFRIRIGSANVPNTCLFYFDMTDHIVSDEFKNGFCKDYSYDFSEAKDKDENDNDVVVYSLIKKFNKIYM